MEVMEEGDLMDRVPVLLNRDMQYYQVEYIYFYCLKYKMFLMHFTESPNGFAGNHLSWNCWWKARFSALRIVCCG